MQEEPNLKALEKTGAMLYAISKFGEVQGKKALHKIMYFSNLKTDYFSFRWHNFGPYSEELKYELDNAIMERMVNVTPTGLQKNEGTQYNMKLSRNGARNLRSIRIGKKTRSSVDFAFKVLNHKNPREMELLASVHYIMNHDEEHEGEEYVWSLLHELKPDAGFTHHDVKRAISQLRNNELIH